MKRVLFIAFLGLVLLGWIGTALAEPTVKGTYRGMLVVMAVVSPSPFDMSTWNNGDTKQLRTNAARVVYDFDGRGTGTFTVSGTGIVEGTGNITSAEGSWPIRYETDGRTITIYQPCVRTQTFTGPPFIAQWGLQVTNTRLNNCEDDEFAIQGFLSQDKKTIILPGGDVGYDMTTFSWGPPPLPQYSLSTAEATLTY